MKGTRSDQLRHRLAVVQVVPADSSRQATASAHCSEQYQAAMPLPPLPLLLALSLPILLLLLLLKPWKKRPNFPPGPRAWPVVGNLPHLLFLQCIKGQQPHVAFASLAYRYGPLIRLRLGSRDLVVASSPSAASHVLKTQDRVLSGRYIPATYRIPFFSDYSLAWATSCDERWKSLRTLCRAELFSSQPLDRFAAVREAKSAEMVGFLSSRLGEEVKIGELVFRTIFNMLGNALFSRDVFASEGGHGQFPQLREHMSRTLEIGVHPNIEDFFPALAGGLDLQGLRREVAVYLNKVYEMWGEIIRERREEMAKDSSGQRDEKDDFLKVLLASGFEDVQLKALMQDIFTAGSDASTQLAEWTMAELVRNPEAMKRVRDELERVVGDGAVLDIHLPRLDYLHACVKEALRLHPPVPLLLPHHALEACEVEGYAIPKGCTVMINAWKIGRDPGLWRDPLAFWPERFVGGGPDYKGMDFELIPFGSGRRTCPGMPLAPRMVELVLASLVRSFEWELPDGKEPRELNMDERLSLVLERKQPLVLIPRPGRTRVSRT